MRYAAAEKLEIIRLVEQSSLSVRRTLAQLGIPRSTFYCWYDRYRAGHAEGLEDRTPSPRRAWNKLPAAVTQAVLELALKAPALSPRELAVSFVDQRRYFVSEASVYRLLKAHDLITSPAQYDCASSSIEIFPWHSTCSRSRRLLAMTRARAFRYNNLAGPQSRIGRSTGARAGR